MKPDALRLAWLFHDAGMIDTATFEQVASREEKDAKSSLLNLFGQLNRDVSMDAVRDSLKSVRDLMLMEIHLPAGGADKAPTPSDLHDALSQPIYLTNEEIKPILGFWQPPLDMLRRIVEEAGDGRERAGAGHLEADYTGLVAGGFLSVRTLNRAAATLDLRLKRLNRILLALRMLLSNDAIDRDIYDSLVAGVESQELPHPPLMNSEFVEFIDLDPDVPEVAAGDVDLDVALLGMFPVTFMRRNLFIPLRRSERGLEIATPDPFYVALSDTLSLLTGLPVLALHMQGSDLIGRLNAIYPAEEGRQGHGGQESEGAPAAEATVVESSVDRRSAVEIVSSIIENGIASRATDVHLEPRSGNLRVRYRIDGHLRPVMELPGELAVSVVSRIKVLGNLDVTERRRPQDGHFSLRFDQGAFDFRISTLPTHEGEKIVIRILDESRVMFDLGSLGMEPRQVEKFVKWLRRPHGLVLVAGPTGSGKTSTLYAGLHTINDESKNVVTIEDPVEYRLAGINQVQVDSNIELTFARGLRATLRQDPDVIMVGEIRDPETAWIALRAALTGHMVLSTLHTNTAAGAIVTLSQMNTEPYMLVSAITGVASQRLVRCLCPSCSKSFVPKQELRQALGLDPKARRRLYAAVGCPECLQTGYRGRTGVYELLDMSDTIAQGILDRRTEGDLIRMSREAGVASLFENAMAKAYKGITSPEEVLERILVE